MPATLYLGGLFVKYRIASPVIARPAIQSVGAKPAVQKVVAAVAKQDVVAGKPVDRVVSGRDSGYLIKPDRYNAAVACAMNKVVAAGAGYVRHFPRPFNPLAAYVGAGRWCTDAGEPTVLLLPGPWCQMARMETGFATRIMRLSTSVAIAASPRWAGKMRACSFGPMIAL